MRKLVTRVWLDGKRAGVAPRGVRVEGWSGGAVRAATTLEWHQAKVKQAGVRAAAPVSAADEREGGPASP